MNNAQSISFREKSSTSSLSSNYGSEYRNKVLDLKLLFYSMQLVIQYRLGCSVIILLVTLALSE